MVAVAGRPDRAPDHPGRAARPGGQVTVGAPPEAPRAPCTPAGADLRSQPRWPRSRPSAASGTPPRAGARSACSWRPPTIRIAPEERALLLRRDPQNVCHLTAGEDRPGDGKGWNRHTRAAGWWDEWRASGVLRSDPAPAIYPLEQTFWSQDGREVRRRGFIAAVRLHEFSEGIIVPHEKTLVAPRAEQLELIKAVRANLSVLFGLYRDPAGATARTLDALLPPDPVAETDTEDGVHHRLWRVEDPQAIAALQGLVRDHRIFIADGHHRYETYMAYQRLLDAGTPGLPADGGHRYAMMFLCPMSDPGLVLYATHRLVNGIQGLSVPRLLEQLARYFTVETLPEDLRRPAGRAWAVARLAEHAGKASTLLMVSAEDQRAHVLTLRDDADLDEAQAPPDETLRALDVTVLHAVVLQHLLGITPEGQAREEHVTYVRDAGEAVDRVLAGQQQLGFLLNPTPMWQVQAVGEAGQTMPQKSTLFAPRLWAGLVMRDVNPRERP
ncbi:MAG: DUF1015 domain-containing protein [Anaeromyxobacter sp.]